MKTRSRIAISAAVAAMMFTAYAPASDLIWDNNGADAPLGQDGNGEWNTSNLNWVNGDLLTGTNVSWNNATPDSAIFGSPANTSFVGTVTPHDVELSENITVQNLTINLSSANTTYIIGDFAGGSLTLAGNVTKAAGQGNPVLLLGNSGLTLTAGNHTFAANDTPNDDKPEIEIQGDVKGDGNVIVDNGPTWATWGTVAFTGGNNSYTGTTTISKGRLEIISSNGLGATSAGTTITNLGTLSIGGSRLPVLNDVNITEPITIQRNTYTGGDFGNYGTAILIANSGTVHTHTISGPLIIDSSDARISVNTNTLVLPGGNISRGPNGATGALSFTGDTAGFVVLQGDNSAALATTGITILGSVEVQPESDAALGGATAPITMTGGVLKPFTGMTTFGAHPINTANFGGGLNIPAGQSFTVDQTITGGNGIGKRGTGTLNFNNPLTATGVVFWDGGIVNVNSPMTLGNFRLRSPQVNIGTGGSVTLTSSFTSIGVDTGGTNGSPDMAVINLTGTGQLVQNNNGDFNISDNPSTKGTINISDNAVFTTNGITWLGKSNNAVGTINQSGGTINIKRTGNFGFVIADGRQTRNPTGFYNLSGGTMNASGEVYVGEGGGGNNVGVNRGHGNWTQTGGAVNLANWFVVGRESAVGNFDISGGTITQTGGNFDLGDSGAGGEVNTVNIHGTASITTSGEFWIANNTGAITNATLADTASVTVNNWLAVGRGNSTGTFTMTGGTITQAGASDRWFTIGSGGTGTVTITGGTINAARMYVGQNGGATSTFNINGGTVNVTNNTVFANGDSATGNLNLNGGTLTAFGFTANSGGGTGKGTFTFNGGTLRANADNANFIGAKVSSVVSTGGAMIDTNGKSVTVASALTHDASLSGADGGLTKSGAGLLKLTGTNTYTGNTAVVAGTLQAGTTASVPAITDPARTIVSPGATLGLSVGGANEFASTSVNAVLASGVLVAGTSLGLDPSNAAGATFTHADVIAGPIGVTKLGSGSLKLAAANTYSGKTTLNGSGSLVLTQPAWAPVLTGAGAVINSSKLVFDYTGTTSPASTVVPLLKVSHDSNNFRDSTKQIYTANAPDANHGLGYLDDGTSSLSVLYTWYGDANGDGKVNADDYALTDRGHAKASSGWQNGDFNYDGSINDDDYMLIDTSFVLSGGGSLSPELLAARESEFGQAYVSQLIAAVPEPTSLSVIGLAGAMTLLGRRRRGA